ncbi:MAG: type II secretion system protein M [Gammaproteobacteria bacterium]|nr:type II secretion system protein M [Gammaproteobacteria bacterium]MBU1732753.1 type II secretion system protein M [Gammaproteobacteria bacterium]MBU1891578.1 type II secretion system protein M [Gammaproteobacteria bacterium]
MNESTSSWWQQLAPRERRLISWGGAGLLAALSYAYMWQPLSTERVKLSASLPQMRADAASMTSQAEEAARLRQSANTALVGPALQAAIIQAINEAGMDAKGVEVTLLDEHRVSISIPKAPFDGWVALAARLQSEKQIHLESCSIEALAEAGMVRVQGMMETKNQTAL